jgi:hypothetical protein
LSISPSIHKRQGEILALYVDVHPQVALHLLAESVAVLEAKSNLLEHTRAVETNLRLETVHRLLEEEGFHEASDRIRVAFESELLQGQELRRQGTLEVLHVALARIQLRVGSKKHLESAVAVLRELTEEVESGKR